MKKIFKKLFPCFLAIFMIVFSLIGSRKIIDDKSCGSPHAAIIAVIASGGSFSAVINGAA